MITDTYIYIYIYIYICAHEYLVPRTPLKTRERANSITFTSPQQFAPSCQYRCHNDQSTCSNIPRVSGTLQLECCGASGPKNYHQSRWFNHTSFADGEFVPVSCCVPLDLSVDREEDSGRRRDGGGGRSTSSDAAIAVENRMSAKLADHLTQCQIDAVGAVTERDAVSLGRVKTQVRI